MKYGLHLGSYADLLEEVPDGAVKLFIVDSPYGNTNLDFDKRPIDWAGEFWPLIRQKLAPNGVVVCFACELFTLDLIASNREWYRYRMVWVKSRASRLLDAAWRPLAAHEDLILFAPIPKSATYNPQRRPHHGPKVTCKRKAAKHAHYEGSRQEGSYEDDGTRHPTTVLEYASVPTMAPHFNPTAKPIALVQELVLTYSNPGDLVAEPFAGDAPAGHACDNTGRLYFGCEVSLEQYEWSRAHLAKKSPLFQ